jgi:hypothetical protein
MKNKNYFKVLLFAFAGTFVFGACQKDNQSVNKNVEGTYVGNFTTTSTLKSTQLAANINSSATVVVSKLNDEQIKIHCFGDELDSTFILNMYNNGDSLMVCLDGSSFEHEYGHMMGQGSMMGGGNIMGNNSTEWGQHMNGEHKVGDEHFGGFNMSNGTFTYSFKMMEGTSTIYKKFQGTKK